MMMPTQIRKNLSYFGRFDKQEHRHKIHYLLRELRQMLRLTQEWPTALVGVVRLGRAIIEYPRFSPQGFRVTVAFDSNSRQVGETFGQVTVQTNESNNRGYP
jgi:redox-sensing transcriptional repressor